MASWNGSWSDVQDCLDNLNTPDTSSTPDLNQSKDMETDDISKKVETVGQAVEALKYRVEALQPLHECHTEQENTKQGLQTLIEAVKALKDRVEALESVQEYRTEREETPISREEVLNAWSKCPLPPSQEGRCKIPLYEGDVRADLLAIKSKEKTDPATADRWKNVFLDRYGISWGAQYRDFDGVDRGTLGRRPINVFNIRARVLHGWGPGREEILNLCRKIIETRVHTYMDVSPSQYDELCRLYYA
ncbi:hypothetical protein N7535_001049 [Penicillium sp. DV-2018c]|nr:hypothetical protein N7461_005710 [Penicillium sp. DV-2018c]KAJ5582429.1 hypothetical protein N7535_001049 [Penicillium sp. DV-2018c]